MKQFKEEIIAAMEATGMNEIRLREVANSLGINHLTRQESMEILNAFVKAHPDYRIVQLMTTPKDSFFVSAAVTTLEYDSEEDYLNEDAEWYIVDDTLGGCFEDCLGDVSKEEAVAAAESMWNDLTAYDKKRRISVSVIKAKLDEDGCIDFDHILDAEDIYRRDA